MTLLLFIAPAFLAAVLAFALTPIARRLALRVGAMDQPGPRKIHTTPTPRLGGLAVLVSAGLVFSAISILAPPKAHTLHPESMFGIALGILPIVIVSLFDDIRPKRAIIKFASHLTGACIAVGAGIRLNPDVHFLGSEVHIGWLAVPISILWLAGITSSFNLIDGLDGLSAGLALISAVSLAAVSLVTRHYEMASAAGILAGALFGFLPYNIFPARIYLGDTGSTAIGFFLGALTLSGGSTTSAGLAVSLPLVVLGLPLADTILSMTRRLLHGAEVGNGIFAADANHIHHRLLALGLSHKRAVLLLYGIGVLLASFGFASVFMSHQNAGLLLGVLLVGAVVGVSKLGYDEFAMVKRGVVLRVYEAPVLRRGLFVVFVDLALVATSLYTALVLKYDDWGVLAHRDMLLGIAPLVAAATILLFAAGQIYRRAWSNASVLDAVKLTVATLSSSGAAYVVARIVAERPPTVTFMITYTLVMLVLVNGVRGSYRVFYQLNRESNAAGEAVLIYGAGRGGALALREILTNTAVPMKPIGFIDDNPMLRGRFINGFPVLGGFDDLSRIVMSGKARGVVITSEKIPIAKVRDAQAVCESRGAWMRVFTIDFRTISGDTDAA